MKAGILLPLVVGLIGLDNPPSSEETKKEVARFQGTWRIVKAEAGGKVFDQLDQGVVRVCGTTWTITAKGKSAQYTCGIETSRDPKALDLVPNEGQDRDQMVLRGIYEASSDYFKVCLGSNDRIVA